MVQFISKKLPGTLTGGGFNCRLGKVLKTTQDTSDVLWNKVSHFVPWIRKTAACLGEQLKQCAPISNVTSPRKARPVAAVTNIVPSPDGGTIFQEDNLTCSPALHSQVPSEPGPRNKRWLRVQKKIGETKMMAMKMRQQMMMGQMPQMPQMPQQMPQLPQQMMPQMPQMPQLPQLPLVPQVQQVVPYPGKK